LHFEVSDAIKHLRVQREKRYTLVRSSGTLREQWQVNMDQRGNDKFHGKLQSTLKKCLSTCHFETMLTSLSHVPG